MKVIKATKRTTSKKKLTIKKKISMLSAKQLAHVVGGDCYTGITCDDTARCIENR